jgi:hypothetical protein
VRQTAAVLSELFIEGIRPDHHRKCTISEMTVVRMKETPREALAPHVEAE